MVKYFCIAALVLAPVWLKAQIFQAGYPRDTSFSVWSASQKVIKDYPHARPVKEFAIPSVGEKRNVIYLPLDNRNLHADLFFPQEKTGQIPAVILIHGGGWASGSKSHLVPLAQKLAENNFFAATIEYRLSPEAKYPAAVTDLKTAVRWLKANARQYNIDTSRIAVLGTSAGATLATLIGTTSGNSLFKTGEFEDHSDKVHAIVNIDGIVDFTDPAESGKDKDPAKPSAGARWFGATYKEKPSLWREASPVNYVGEDTPPVLFINSSIPRFHAGRDLFLRKLDEHTIKNRVVTIPDTPHPFWLFYPWFDQVYPATVSFLEEVFN